MNDVSDITRSRDVGAKYLSVDSMDILVEMGGKSDDLFAQPCLSDMSAQLIGVFDFTMKKRKFPFALSSNEKEMEQEEQVQPQEEEEEIERTRRMSEVPVSIFVYYRHFFNQSILTIFL
jgi:hypothetical protein